MDMTSTWLMLLAAIVVAGLVVVWRISRARAGMGGRTAQKAHQASPGRRTQPNGDQLDTVMAWEPLATRVLTNSERDAFVVLRKALPDHMVLAQVPVARFIKVPTRNSYNEWLRRVGSLCADLVVCDIDSQVIAVVEVRQPLPRERDRAQKRHARLDRVLKGANIPVYVWLEGALPGAARAREAILGEAAAAMALDEARPAYQDMSTVKHGTAAAAVVASMQTPTGAMRGLEVDERADFNADVWFVDFSDENHGSQEHNGHAVNGHGHNGHSNGHSNGHNGDHLLELKEPPPSTWFDDLDSGSGHGPLDTPVRHHH